MIHGDDVKKNDYIIHYIIHNILDNMQHTTYILDNIYNIKNAYDCFDDFGFYTNGFTENMDEIEIINFEHKYFTYLDAIIDLNIIKDKIYHCYYQI